MICDKITHDINCNIIVKDEDNFDSNYVYIYVLQLNKYNSKPITQVFVKTKESEKIIFDGQDGYYTLAILKVPTNEQEPYYYKDSKLYNQEGEEVSLTTILNLNPNISHILVNFYYYFQTCFLRKAFVKIASEIINNAQSVRCESKKNSSDTYKRDLLWSALNVIKYLVESGCYAEAERIIERISSCNGLYENNCQCGC